MSTSQGLVQLGHSTIKIHPLGLGVMGMSPVYGPVPPKEEAIKVIHRFIELGGNFFDTADIYGQGHNETLLGEAIKTAHVPRKDLFVATKFAISFQPDGSIAVVGKPAYVKEAIERSLKRLGLDYVDLYYQHRVDPTTPIEDTVKAMADLVKEGKVKYLGLSECSVKTLRRAHAVHPISALQVEYSLFSTDIETNGILDTCRELGITVVAYSPLARGFLGGKIRSVDDLDPNDWRRTNPRFSPENFGKNLELLKVIEELAKEKNCTPSQLALAWVLVQPGVVTIPGTKKKDYLEENFGALKVHLTDGDLKKIREILNTFPVVGQRYADELMASLDL